jgi:hypothetical protein
MEFKPSDDARLAALVEEWKQTIATQMHFNDLIIRFRTIVLTAFSTIVGALAVIVTTIFQATPHSSTPSFKGVYVLLLCLWFVAGFIDAFYYHRLLLGSVEHAKKFDENEVLKSLQLFGLTTNINKKVSRCWSYSLIAIFYIVPAGVAIWILGAVF